MYSADWLPTPRRAGPRAATTPGIPHLQLDQWAAAELQAQLWERMRALDGVVVGSSGVGPFSARAISLRERDADGPWDAFLAGTEFAHLHGDGSGSLHLTLPPAVAATAILAGWVIRHPFAGDGFLPGTATMVFGPRDDRELEMVWGVVRHSYLFARGLAGHVEAQSR